MKGRTGTKGKINQSVWAVILLSLLLLVQGCASIVTGRSQEMSFSSEPDEATVTVNGRTIGKTPITLNMKKKSGQSVTFEKEGYKSQTMRLTTGLQPWFWGNILIGGLIGSTTDGITGAVHEYSPSQFMVNLAPIDGSIDTSKSEAKMFIIANYKDILEELNTTQGQYLSSLLVLLRVAEEHRADAVKGIKIWADATKDIPNFANMVVTHYMDYRK